MIKFANKKNIIWDFDGVLIDSHEVREKGFKLVLSEFPETEVDLLLDYHWKNGGLSRYVKFDYFFKTIRKEAISEEELLKYAENFSVIMREYLIHPDILIEDSLQFVKMNYEKFRMHIVSGSDGNELRFLCDKLGISKYFKSIGGSPEPKIELVKELLEKYEYSARETVLIGDSINDFEAARESDVDFYGYNKPELIGTGKGYIESFL